MNTSYEELMAIFAKRYEEYDELLVKSFDLIGLIAAVSMHMYGRLILDCMWTYNFGVHIGSSIKSAGELVDKYCIEVS